MQTLLKPCQNCHKPMNGGVYRSSNVCPHCSFEHAGGKQKHKLSAVKTPRPAANDQVAQVTATQAEVAQQVQAAAPAAKSVASNVQPSKAQPSKAQPSAIKAEAKSVKPAPVKYSRAPSHDYLVEEHHEPEAPVANAPEATASANAAGSPTSSNNVMLTTKKADEQNILAVMESVSAECVLNIDLTPDLFKDGKFIGSKSEAVVAALKQGKKNALADLRIAAHEVDANMVTDIAVKNGMKVVDSSHAKVSVTATGTAVVAELAEDACEV